MPRLKKHYPLLNHCYRSEISVFPKNWESKKASINKEWFIWYRFYDAGNSKLIKIRGMNAIHDISQRQRETRLLIESETDLIDKQGYNPITETYMKNSTGDSVSSTTLIIPALEFALDKVELDPKYKAGVKSTLKYTIQAIKNLRLDSLKICDVKRGNLTMVLEECKTMRNLSPTRYNQYRTDLIILFKKLMAYDCVEYNPAEGTEKRKTIKKIRAVPTMEEREKIDAFLKAHHYSFWRFVNIFFHSGARIRELLRLKTHDVYLNQSEFKVVVKKGKSFKEVIKPIKDISLPLWTEILSEATQGDYLFARGLQPAPTPIDPLQVTKRWYRHVKIGLNVTADFYSLKHLNLTEVMDELTKTSVFEAATNEAIALSSHSDGKMLETVYDLRSNQRKGERIKKIGNRFA